MTTNTMVMLCMSPAVAATERPSHLQQTAHQLYTAANNTAKYQPDGHRKRVLARQLFPWQHHPGSLVHILQPGTRLRHRPPDHFLIT